MTLMNDVFYPDVFSNEEQKAILKSRLWPLVSGLYLKTDKQLQLTKFLPGCMTVAASDVATMSLREGWPVALLTSSADGRYQARVFKNNSTSQWVECADTQNLSYLLSRATCVLNASKKHNNRKKQHFGSALRRKIGSLRGTTQPQSEICAHIERIIREWSVAAINSYGHLKAQNNDIKNRLLSRTVTEFLVSNYINNIPFADAPLEMREAICAAYDKIKKELQEKNNAYMDADEMWSADRPKWWVCYISNYGWVISKLQSDKFAGMAKHYLTNRVMPDVMPSHFTAVHPFRYYPTLHHMPPHLLQELLPRMQFAKINRNQYPGTTIGADPDNFVCTDDLIQASINAISSHYVDYYWLVVDGDA